MLLLLPRNVKKNKKKTIHLLFCTRSTRKRKKANHVNVLGAPLIFWDETRTKIQCIRIQQNNFFLFSIQFTLYHVAGIQKKKKFKEKLLFSPRTILPYRFTIYNSHVRWTWWGFFHFVKTAILDDLLWKLKKETSIEKAPTTTTTTTLESSFLYLNGGRVRVQSPRRIQSSNNYAVALRN